ncbi:DUF6777 domain-containing protein [Streptomyces bullii]|uniref:DUF6777 domain-containing protein n=1 Tax=Streptomyces bullii TaxID=349910 RepID=A0ABW0UIR1_9ACTN
MKAVAAGVPSLAPFFDESSGLGRDADVRSRPARGGLQQGDSPGLYGGTRQPTICDVDRLERYLTDPRNHRKAQAWATARGIHTGGIREHLDRLTPVLLRHDTLVENHDYKKGKAVPFPALLQAGIAILVDERGLPAVKCSCGNPLRPFQGDAERISVTFEDGNKKWKGYDPSSVVAVRPAPRKLERLALVDVEDPDRGIERPVGTTGEADSLFDTRERRAVPRVAGTTFGTASRRLTDAGLAVVHDGAGLPSDGARVTASDPAAGTRLRFGAYVTLSVAGGAGGDTSPGTSRDDPGGTDTSPGSGSSRAVPPTSTSSSGPDSPGPTDSGSTPSGPTDSGPSGSGPAESGSTGPTGPGSTDPGPTGPGPTDSGPTGSDPTDPGSTDPGPPDSGRTDPGPTDSRPTDSGEPTVSAPTREEPSREPPPPPGAPPSSEPPPPSNAAPRSSPPSTAAGSPPAATGSPPTGDPVTGSAPPPLSSVTARRTPAATATVPASGTPAGDAPVV